jgi:uncharacterized protein
MEPGEEKQREGRFMPFNFLPKEEQFFVLFEDAAHNIVEAARRLEALVGDFDQAEEKAAAIRNLEARGDEITFQVISLLGKAIVTPIEREDILQIARALDDIVDYIDASASRLVSYAIGEPTEASRQFAALIVAAATDLQKVMALLHRRDIRQIAVPKSAINRVESEADRLLRRVVAALFSGGHDPLYVIKWKEIYETMEEVTDRIENLANVIEGIIIKNT